MADARARFVANPRVVRAGRLLALDARDMRGMASDVDREFRRHERTLFSSEGRAAGQAWRRLSPAYEKYKKRVRPGRKKMVFDGDLHRSLTVKSDPNHVLRWALKPRAFIAVGTRDPKALWHGPKDRSSQANPRLPVRDVLAHTRAQLMRYPDAIRRYFVRVKLPRFWRAARAWKGVR